MMRRNSCISRLITSLLIFLFSSSGTFSQSDNPQCGSYSRAFSDASSAFGNHWAVHNNPGALALVKDFSTGFFIQNRFNIMELNEGAFALALPVKGSGTFGLGIYSFQQSVVYTRQKFSLNWSSRLAKSIYTGVGLNYIRIHTDEYPAVTAISGEIGTLCHLSGKSNLGIHVFNPFGIRYNDASRSRIPTIMRVGLTRNVSESAMLAVEIENSTLTGIALKGGLQYKLGDKIDIIGGLRTNPVNQSFGLVVRAKSLQFIVSLQFHQVLSASPGLSVDYLSNIDGKGQ